MEHTTNDWPRARDPVETAARIAQAPAHRKAQPPTRKTLYLLDGHALIHRAYHAKFHPLSTTCPKCRAPGNERCPHCEGTGREPTKATYVFTKALLQLVRERKPNWLAVAVDGPRDQLIRRQISAGYKANRDGHPTPGLAPQIRRCRQLVEALGIPVLASPGWEADDVIATVVDAVGGLTHIETIIVARDKDLSQLIGPGVRMFDPIERDYLDGRWVLDRFGVHPAQMRDYLALVGDSVDNVPGVEGIGEKKAVALLSHWGSVSNLLNNLPQRPPKDPAVAKASQLVWDRREMYLLSKALVNLNRDVPLDVTAEQLECKGINVNNARPLFRVLGFKQWSEW